MKTNNYTKFKVCIEKIMRHFDSSFCLFLILFGLVISFFSCRKQVIPEPEESYYHLVGYVAGWNNNPLSSIPAQKLTHINYAFLNLQDGKVVSSMENDSVNLVDLVNLKTINPSLKVLVSIGGATWSGDFSDAALTDSSRAVFSNSIINFIKQYKLDGVDIDWEFPGIGDFSRSEDKENFTFLLQEIRFGLNQLELQQNRAVTDPYLLTIASGASSWYLSHIEPENIVPLLDYINIMTYDFSGSWSYTTGHHTNLYKSDLDPSGFSIVESVQAYVSRGVPREKLIVGAAFYGRYWEGVTRQNSGMDQPYSGASGSYTFSYIENNLLPDPDFMHFWDDQAKASWLWNEKEGIFVSYDDANSVKNKTDFVKLNQLGGMMFWEYAQDDGHRLLYDIYNGLKN